MTNRKREKEREREEAFGAKYPATEYWTVWTFCHATLSFQHWSLIPVKRGSQQTQRAARSLPPGLCTALNPDWALAVLVNTCLGKLARNQHTWTGRRLLLPKSPLSVSTSATAVKHWPSLCIPQQHAKLVSACLTMCDRKTPPPPPNFHLQNRWSMQANLVTWSDGNCRDQYRPTTCMKYRCRFADCFNKD